MAKFQVGDCIGTKLCKLWGIDASTIQSIEIHIDPKDVVYADVKFKKLLDQESVDLLLSLRPIKESEVDDGGQDN